jgi:regulatory protein CII
MSSRESECESYKTRCICREWLFDALYDTVHRSPVKAKVIAERLHVSTQLLYSWATDPSNKSGGHRCMDLKWLLPLSTAAENFLLLDELERQAGRQVPATQEHYEGSLETLAMETGSRMATVLSQINAAMIDAKFCAQDAQKMLPLLRRLRLGIDLFEAQVQETVQAHRREDA